MEKNPEHAPPKEPMPRKTPDPSTIKKLGKTAIDGGNKK